MFYVFDTPITAGDTDTNKIRLPMDLTAGVIHQVDVLFQHGCNHQAHVQIFQANFQLWPTNRGKTIRGNATLVSFREFHELASGASDLYAMVWGDGTITAVEIIIQIGLLPKHIIQPMNFEALLEAAAGLEP